MPIVGSMIFARGPLLTEDEQAAARTTVASRESAAFCFIPRVKREEIVLDSITTCPCLISVDQMATSSDRTRSLPVDRDTRGQPSNHQPLTTNHSVLTFAIRR